MNDGGMRFLWLRVIADADVRMNERTHFIVHVRFPRLLPRVIFRFLTF
jgi:hypothetical protein